MSIFHHLNIMRKARKHGHLFPAMGQRPKPAPMGSSQPNTHGSWLRRIRDEAYWFRHSNHSIDLPDWPKLHILHLTDVHLRDTGPFLDRIIVEITGLNPDIIVITGDLVTKGYTEKSIRSFCAALPKVPTFAILGNWEHHFKFILLLSTNLFTPFTLLFTLGSR